MAVKKKTNDGDVITLDIQPFLTPISIIIASIIMALGFIIGMGNLNGVKLNTGSTTTTDTDTTGTATDLGSLAEAIGLNKSDFLTCNDARETEDEVKADTSAGSQSGISGTPGFIIGDLSSNGDVNGYLVSGALPFDVFRDMVDGVKDNDQSKIDGVLATYADYIVADSKTTIDDDAMLGNKDSVNVAIVEFTDFQCPFCQRHHNEVYPTIVNDIVNAGKAIYVIRDFPLSFHEPVATNKAIAAECAGKIGGDSKYFEYVDKLFELTI